MKVFLFLILFSSSIISQENQNQQDYISLKLIPGIPISLTNNSYFYQPENVSYAILYKNERDTVYFISKKINSDSSNYVLTATTNNRISGYDFLNFKKINDNKIYMTGKINLAGRAFELELFCFPNDEAILYKFLKKSAFALSFKLGIRDELDLMLVKYRAGNSIEFGILPINIHLTTGVRFLEHYKIDIRYGIMVIYEDFEGFDIGIFLQYNLFSSNFYGSLGIDYFNAIGSSHNSGSTGGSFTFYCLGLGYNVSKHFNLDLMYCFPNEKVFAYYQSDFFSQYQGFNEIDNGLIKIGFQYSFLF